MGLESATYINDLVSSNPAATDLRGQGDDHIRLIKAAVKATFPNATKPFYLPSGTSLQTSTVTVAASDDNKLIPVSCEAAARTVNLPQGSTLPDGFTVKIVKADNSINYLTVDGYSSETINGALTITLYQKYQQAVLQWVSSLSGWIASIQEILPAGSIAASYISTAPPGWVLMAGGTIGNASSGAGLRANADCLSLFQTLWNNVGDTYAAVSSGRGTSAATDFAANKTIVVPHMQGRVPVGVDGMAGSTWATLSAVTGNYSVSGYAGGAATHQLLYYESGFPGATASISISDPGHIHALAATGLVYGGEYTAGGGPVSTPYYAGVFSTTALQYTGISASVSISGAANAAAAHNNVQPYRLVYWMIKL